MTKWGLTCLFLLVFSIVFAQKAPKISPGSFKLTAADPNPFHNKTTFKIMVGKTQKVKIEILDLLGQQVMILHDDLLSEQYDHQFSILAEKLKRGNMYFYKIKGETFLVVRKIIVERE